MALTDNIYGLRTVPTQPEFLENRQINDILYGFLQTYSIYDTDAQKRYVYKRDASPKKILEAFKEELREQLPSERRLRDHITLLKKSSFLKEDEINGQRVYILPDMEKGHYVFIKATTLQFLVNTATYNVIKTYAFLKIMYQRHVNLKYPALYRFSKQSLLGMLGYTPSSISSKSTLKMVSDVLTTLVNNGLIEYSEVWVETNQDNVTHYYALKKVNEDYILPGPMATKRALKDQAESEYIPTFVF